jgi:hypothetical protein
MLSPRLLGREPRMDFLVPNKRLFFGQIGLALETHFLLCLQTTLPLRFTKSAVRAAMALPLYP